MVLVEVLMICGCNGSGHSSASTPPAIPQSRAELKKLAAKSFRGKVVDIYDYKPDWSSKEFVSVTSSEGEGMDFLKTEAGYVLVDLKDDLHVLNEVMSEYTFPRTDFGIPDRRTNLLEVLADFDGIGRLVCSSMELRVLERSEALQDWLEGSSVSEEEFRNWCKDPEFVFTGNRWRVRFKVLFPGGSVEQWHVSGEFLPDSNSNHIYTIERKMIKPEGTIKYSMMG